MANKSMVEILLDKGHELQEGYAAFLEQKNANRRSLRDLATQGLLTDEQILELDELYPPRVKSDEDESAE